MTKLFFIVLGIVFAISAGLNLLLPPEYRSNVFWSLLTITACITGIYSGRRAFSDDSKHTFLDIVIFIIFGMIALGSPALLGISLGFGVDIFAQSTETAQTGNVIDGAEGVMPSFFSFHFVSFFIGWATTRFRKHS